MPPVQVSQPGPEEEGAGKSNSRVRSPPLRGMLLGMQTLEAGTHDD